MFLLDEGMLYLCDPIDDGVGPHAPSRQAYRSTQSQPAPRVGGIPPASRIRSHKVVLLDGGVLYLRDPFALAPETPSKAIHFPRPAD